jgi:hypothetical protein
MPFIFISAVHSTLSHILCRFVTSRVLLGILVAIETGLAVTHPTGNLRSLFLVFFTRL